MRKKEKMKSGITISSILTKYTNFYNPNVDNVVVADMGLNNHHIETPTLNNNSVVLDFGAHKGEYIHQISRNFACNIFAYEPTPDLFHILNQKYKDVKKINILNEAVWTEDTTKDFYEYSCSEGRANSFGAKQNHYANDTNVLSVQTKSLDSILKRFDTVDICKMDIEGAEVEVLLKASDETLLKCNQICGEFHSVDFTSKNIKKGLKPITTKNISDVVHKLNKIGFKHIITDYYGDGNPQYIVFYQEEKINE